MHARVWRIRVLCAPCLVALVLSCVVCCIHAIYFRSHFFSIFKTFFRVFLFILYRISLRSFLFVLKVFERKAFLYMCIFCSVAAMATASIENT